jgi:hypothetical protein
MNVKSPTSHTNYRPNRKRKTTAREEEVEYQLAVIHGGESVGVTQQEGRRMPKPLMLKGPMGCYASPVR